MARLLTLPQVEQGVYGDLVADESEIKIFDKVGKLVSFDKYPFFSCGHLETFFGFPKNVYINDFEKGLDHWKTFDFTERFFRLDMTKAVYSKTFSSYFPSLTIDSQNFSIVCGALPFIEMFGVHPLPFAYRETGYLEDFELWKDSALFYRVNLTIEGKVKSFYLPFEDERKFYPPNGIPDLDFLKLKIFESSAEMPLRLYSSNLTEVSRYIFTFHRKKFFFRNILKNYLARRE